MLSITVLNLTNAEHGLVRTWPRHTNNAENDTVKAQRRREVSSFRL